MYIFDNTFSEKFKKLNKSNRGEYEIVDIIKEYGIENCNPEYIGRGTAWFDMGTNDDFFNCELFVKTLQDKQGLLICSPHEISYRNGWISKDRLFETLDTKISRVYLGENIYIGLIDTVGFINNIPTSLIESFKATLEEVNKADILLNIVDVNDLNANQKIRVTKSILVDTGVEKNKISEMITIYNKIDIKGSKSSYQHKKNYISALTGEGISDLKWILKKSLI